MTPVEEFLKTSRVLEILQIDEKAVYGTFQTLLDEIMPGIKVIPVRSISADTFCVRIGGIPTIVWDETYADYVVDIAEILLGWEDGRDGASLVICVMADLLFEEGLYVEAWIAGAIGTDDGSQVDSDEDGPDVGPGHSANRRLQRATMRSFLFLHEVGHLLRDQNPELFAIYKDDIEAAANSIEVDLGQLTRTGIEMLLCGQGFMQFSDIHEGKDCAQSELLKVKNFVNECVADSHAVDVIMGQLSGRQITNPHILGEAIMALRLAMEVVRDIRVAAKCIAQEERPTPPASRAEQMRALILRHYTSDVVSSAAQHRGDQQAVTTEFRDRYQRLFERKTSKFDGISDSLMSLAFGRIRQYRDRMTKLNKLMALNLDTSASYRDQYLRSRYWSPG